MTAFAPVTEPREAGMRDHRRSRGIYYTPLDVARCLASWAIRTPSDLVLDPSFGGCAFVRASLECLSALGAPSPERGLFGVDSDLSAMSHLASLANTTFPAGQFHTGDFLRTTVADFPSQFSAVIGNPPYIRHHALGEVDHESARLTVSEAGIRLSDQASYWAYFVLHAIKFVAPGGRLGFVLPGVFVHAEYAKQVRQELTRSFARITAIFVDERIFPDAQEETVLVFADERVSGSAKVFVGAALRSELAPGGHLLANAMPISETEREKSWLRGVLNRNTLAVYDDLTERSRSLGDLAKIRIGEVTGANRFFIMTPDEFDRLGVSREIHVRSIITRAAQLPGIDFTNRNLKHLETQGERMLLLCVAPTGRLPSGIREYIEVGEQQGLPSRSWCAKRNPWFRIKPPSTPDAFLLYMSWLSPRLVLNTARVACTNTIHALTWKEVRSKAECRQIAFASLSTLSQLSAEIEGRSYGGGVLKLEPSEAARLLIPVRFDLDIRSYFAQCNRLCYEGNREFATETADRVLLRPLVPKKDLDRLQEALCTLRRRRATRAARSGK